MYRACALQTCPSTLLTRSLRRRAGVNVGEQWYCTVDCFAAASRTRLMSLMGGNLLEMRHNPRLSIGLVLLSKGYLTADQLRSATAESQIYGEALEATLMRLGFANEKQLVAARAAQWGYPVLARDREAIHVESDIPPALLNRYSAVPLHYSVTAKRLLLGFVYRVEQSLLSSVELITDLRVEPCFIDATALKEQMRRVTTVPNYEEVVFEDVQTPAQMAKNVGGFAVEVAASDARFARCGDEIWARLVGKRGKIDLLFRSDTLLWRREARILCTPGRACGLWHRTILGNCR